MLGTSNRWGDRKKMIDPASLRLLKAPADLAAEIVTFRIALKMQVARLSFENRKLDTYPPFFAIARSLDLLSEDPTYLFTD